MAKLANCINSWPFLLIQTHSQSFWDESASIKMANNLLFSSYELLKADLSMFFLGHYGHGR